MVLHAVLRALGHLPTWSSPGFSGLGGAGDLSCSIRVAVRIKGTKKPSASIRFAPGLFTACSMQASHLHRVRRGKTNKQVEWEEGELEDSALDKDACSQV